MKTRPSLTLDTVLPGRSGRCPNLEWQRCGVISTRCALAILLAAAAFARPAYAARPAAEASARLLARVGPRIKAIYERDEFAMRSFTATWLPDGSGYLRLETPAGATVAEVARCDAASGQRTVVVPGEKLIVPGGSQLLKLRWFQRAPSGDRFLLNGDFTGGGRGSGHWLYEPESGALYPVDDGPGLWFDANAFSPDGRRLLAPRGADLVVFDIASGRTIPLTKAAPFFMTAAFNLPHYPGQPLAKFKDASADMPMPRQSYARVISSVDDLIGPC